MVVTDQFGPWCFSDFLVVLVEGSSRFLWSFWLLNHASLSANAVSVTLSESLMCWWNLSPKGENSAPFLQELKLFGSQRIELLYRWTLGHSCCLIEYSGALCIETLYLTFLIFRSGLHNAHASSVWMWTILTSMAVQRNWLICPQTCKLLAFNLEEFLTLAYLFLCSLCFYCHLLSGQGSKTYFWESVSTFLADTNNKEE